MSTMLQTFTPTNVFIECIVYVAYFFTLLSLSLIIYFFFLK